MGADSWTLSIALSDNELTRPILRGEVQAQGLRLLPTKIFPSEMFWRQLKYGDFDVSEMSLSSLLIAAARGDRTWVALPIFTSRRFFHANFMVRSDRGIDHPRDLIGKRIGVPEYQQTAALWVRGALEHEFGVSPRDIQWFMERGQDRSHGAATGFTPPPGVELQYVDPRTNLGEMLANGELDGTAFYITSDNLVDRSRIDLTATPNVEYLFRDRFAEMHRYFRKTGIYPINHVVVMRRELYEKHSWMALNLYHAFLEAKRSVQRDLTDSMKGYFDTGAMAPVGPGSLNLDPKPYGMKACEHVLKAIASYSFEQGLTPRVVDLEEVFAPSTMAL